MKATKTPTAIPSFDQVPLGHSEYALEPWVYKRCARNPRRRRLVSSSCDSVMDSRTEQDVLEASRNDCRTPRRPLDKNLSFIRTRRRQPRKCNQEMGRRPQFIHTTNQSSQRQQRSHERHDLKIPCLLQTRSSTVSTPQHHESLNLSCVLILVCAHSTSSHAQTSRFCCLATSLFFPRQLFRFCRTLIR